MDRSYSQTDKLVIGFLTATAILAPTFLLATYFWPVKPVLIHRSVQPSNIKYDLYDPYELQLLRGRNDQVELQLFPSPKSERYYSIDIDFLPTQESVSKSNWTSHGVEIVISSGHKLFIPQKSFSGGR